MRVAKGGVGDEQALLTLGPSSEAPRATLCKLSPGSEVKAKLAAPTSVPASTPYVQLIRNSRVGLSARAAPGRAKSKAIKITASDLIK